MGDILSYYLKLHSRIHKMQNRQYEKIDRGFTDEGPSTRVYAQIRLQVLREVMNAMNEEYESEVKTAKYWDERLSMKRGEKK